MSLERPADLRSQYGYFRRRHCGVIVFEVGRYVELFDRDGVWAARELGLQRIRPRPGFYARCGVHRARGWRLVERLAAIRQHVLVVGQRGVPRGRVMDRVGVAVAVRP